jgi:signal transduction histidine kinase
LGIAIAPTLVRRLRRLRQAALRLASGGPPVELPVDRARDEVGDLARTFTIMQRRLQHQEEARRAFVATASHELRTPLASLDGMLELLDDDLRGGEPDLDDARELLERARAQSRRLGRLAADLLDLSRLDAEVALRSEPVELGELSRAVLAEFELGTGERGITTVLDDDAGPVWALGDPGSVARIVRILLDNAVKLSPVGGEVTVELRNGDSASLTVCDRGPGVAPEERELIFQRFMRGRQTAGQVGFGLGLAIGRELALRMGGELVLEDDHGPGARFTLRLPVAKAPDLEPVAVS